MTTQEAGQRMVMVQWMPDQPNGILVQFPSRWEAIELVDMDNRVRKLAEELDTPCTVYLDLGETLMPPIGVLNTTYHIFKSHDFSHVEAYVIIAKSKIWYDLYRKFADFYGSLVPFEVRCVLKDEDARTYP